MKLDRVKFDRNLYAEAWRILRLVWPYALSVVVCDYAVGLMRPLFAAHLGDIGVFYALGVEAIFWGLLAYMAHAEILLPDTGKSKIRISRILGFSMRLVAVALLILVFFSIVPVPIAIALDVSGWIDIGTLYALRLPENLSMAASALLVALMIFGFLTPFILIGTLFPAYVADHRRGLGLAFGRGRRQFLWMTGWLIAGPGLVGVCVTGMLSFAKTTFDPAGFAAQPFGFGMLVLEVAGLVSLLGWIYVVVMMAVLLSRAYLRDLTATRPPSPEEALFLSPEPP